MEIRINNDIYTVEFVDADRMKMNTNEGCFFGLTDYENTLISIRRGLAESMERSTIYHELTHAFLFSYGHAHGDFTEEMVCDFIGAHLEEIKRITDMILESEECNADRKRD